MSLEILSLKTLNISADKGQSDLLLAMQTNLLLQLYIDYTAISRPPPHTPKATLLRWHEEHGWMPSPSPQNTCGLVEQTPINPQAPCGEYRAGPMFHDQDELRCSSWIRGSINGQILLASTIE